MQDGSPEALLRSDGIYRELIEAEMSRLAHARLAGRLRSSHDRQTSTETEFLGARRSNHSNDRRRQ